MNFKDFTIKSSRRDPAYSVSEIEGKIFRRIDVSQVKAIELLNGKRKVFPTILDSKVILDSSADFYEVEKIPFIAQPYELPFQLLKDTAIFYLQLLQNTLGLKCSLKDATPFNIVYMGEGNFLHFDLGSIESFDVNTGWKGYRQFLGEFYFPLLYLKENKGIYTTDLIKLFFDKQWIYHYSFGWLNYLSPAFSINYVFYKNSRIRKLTEQQSKKSLKISEKQVLQTITLLKEGIKNMELPKVKTKWDDYYSQTVLQNGYVAEKEKVVEVFLKSLEPKTVKYAIDWGANDGKFSGLLVKTYSDATVISVESDYNAVNSLYLKYKHKRIIPVYTDVLNLSPDLGFDGERSSLKDRISKVADLQLCLGLIHHLIHQENLSFETIIDFFATCSKADSYLVVEFINTDDPRHKLVKNPNYPYPLNREYFLESLNKQYKILDSKVVIPTREIFLCKKIS